jgi:hypothetical protein
MLTAFHSMDITYHRIELKTSYRLPTLNYEVHARSIIKRYMDEGRGSCFTNQNFNLQDLNQC